jgi:hypothetical protein
VAIGIHLWMDIFQTDFSDPAAVASDTILQFIGHAPAPGLRSKICVETNFSSNFEHALGKTEYFSKRNVLVNFKP